MDLDQISVRVTGGASGLGGATAMLLAGRGARVTTLDVNAEARKAAASVFGGHFVAADVTDRTV